jgi:hypothetical protein
MLICFSPANPSLRFVSDMVVNLKHEQEQIY